MTKTTVGKQWFSQLCVETYESLSNFIELTVVYQLKEVLKHFQKRNLFHLKHEKDYFVVFLHVKEKKTKKKHVSFWPN